jgi:Asp-tRNA(Asn)/Glu-tRNA(Gln) amidotransferase A subunit family amidase
MPDKKWYNYFVSVESTGASTGEPPPPMDDAAKAVADIAASLSVPAAAPAPAQAKPNAGPAPAMPPAAAASGKPMEFAEIYAAAEITAPPHGYTVLKVADMLQSPHIKDLPAEVRRSSILVALDAAGVKVANIVEDAVRRDKALDAFERIQQKSVDDFEAAKLDENRKLQAELDKLTTEYKARIQANTDATTKRRESFAAWRVQKQIEEQKIADCVGYFVTENPITTTRNTPKPAGA